jgi:very-short-patch-repair endonuclease
MEQADKQNFWAYNKTLQPFANNLRKRMTKAEACLWKYVLRANKMKGYGFRRQRPIMNYIADFMCKELMLVIEVDGFTHWNDETKKKDEEKDKILQLAGFTILRFTDEEVLNNLLQVEEKIKKWIEEKEKQKI